ncbi:MAG: hypothetical protein KC417_10550, partial [Myxococcales bacterium]|nr:hypothetical protein [Myxococcales bacterium]
MSESAKPKTSASDALSPDEAERVAAKFRPSWERVAAPRAAKQTLLGVAPVTPEPEPAASPNPAPAPPEATVIVAPQAAPASTREVTEVLRMPTTSRSSTPPEFLQGRSNLRYWVAAALAVIAAGAFVALRSRNAGETPTSETSSTASSEASSAPATATGSAGNAPDESPEEATELAAAGPAEAEPTDTEPVA